MRVASLRNSASACKKSGKRAAIQLKRNNPLLFSSSRWRTLRGIYATSPTGQLSVERVSRLSWHPNLNSRPRTLTNMRARRVQKLTIICVAAFTGGCASGDLDAVSPYADPGRYDFLDCTSIAQRIKEASDREKHLHTYTNKPTNSNLTN